VFTGNVIYPNGYTCLWLTQANNCNVSHNTFTTWYTGEIQIEGNMNSVFANNITAALANGAWAADPQGRNGQYGLVRISGNDNVMDDNIIMSWQPVNDVRVGIATGSRNVLRISISAPTTARTRYLRMGR